MSDNQIVINDLSKVYDNGFKALKNINLDIKKGEITKITKITFTGDKKIREKRLRDIIASEEHKFYKVISKNTKFSQNLINLDTVNCQVKTIDRYKRYIATCYKEKTNLNQWMVRNGYAIAYRRYSKKYISDESINPDYPVVGFFNISSVHGMGNTLDDDEIEKIELYNREW